MIWVNNVLQETKVHVWMNRQNAEAESVNVLGNTTSPMANVVSSKMISIGFTMHGMIQNDLSHWATIFHSTDKPVSRTADLTS